MRVLLLTMMCQPPLVVVGELVHVVDMVHDVLVQQSLML